MEIVREIWRRAISVQPQPSALVVALTALAALVLVVFPVTWQLVRQLVTIVHEGSHAVVAVLVGRRLQGIRLHNDTSGLTVSRGRPTGPGMVGMLAAGYLGPAIVGVVAALLLLRGHALGLLWIVVVLLLLLLLQIRNLYGATVVLFCLIGVAAISWYFPADQQSVIAYLITWLLLWSAPKPLVELLIQRSRGEARHSDADQIARLTHVPGIVWNVLFLLANLGGLVVGIWLLIPALARLISG